jgi:protein-tyrosine phosphatase
MPEHMKLLFVCGGNTCRSPMASAIARRVLGASVKTENAGIAPYGDSATSDAIAVTHDLFGIDLTSHRPQEVDSGLLAGCDYIIALDSYVARHLREEYCVSSSRLIEWQIDDPYLKGREAYERCAKAIESAVRALKEEVTKRVSPVHRAGGAASSQAGTSLDNAINDLRQDLERWTHEIAEGAVRGTLLHGIAKKAVDTFESILRRTVDIYSTLAADSERGHEKRPPGKPFERLTLGELIHDLKKNNKHYTTAARQTAKGSHLFRNRTVVSPIGQLLDHISTQRNILHHYPQKFAPDMKTLQKNTTNLLSLLSEALEDQLFDYAAAQERA